MLIKKLINKMIQSVVKGLYLAGVFKWKVKSFHNSIVLSTLIKLHNGQCRINFQEVYAF